MSCKPLYSDIRDVGKTISSTKKLHIWKFSLDKKDYTIELYNSMLSGKKKIVQNGQVVYENNSYQGAFQYPFSIGRNSLSIVQHGDRYELRINNQSFDHLMNQRSTSDHFKSDFGDQPQERRREPKRSAPARDNVAADEDADLRRAIELSKQTAKQERNSRVNKNTAQEKNFDEDDLDFGSNFEKFATYKAGNVGGDNINDFDFNAVIEKKEEQKQGEFDFNFNDSKAKGSAPAKVPDLMDLLDGGNMNAQPANPQPVQPQPQAMNFGATNQQPAATFDPFSPTAPVNNQPAESEKPKFVPNPVFQTGMLPGSQQQMMYNSQYGQNPMSQQAMQMQQNLAMGMQNQYFQTGQPQYMQQPGQMQMGQPMGMQQPMGAQAQNPFDAFGGAPAQQPMMNQMQQQPPQQQQTKQQESTPFDMFA